MNQDYQTIKLAKEAVKEIRIRNEIRQKQKQTKFRAKPKVPGYDIVMEDSVFEAAVKLLIAKNFGESDKFRVFREAKIYRPSKSKTIRNQLSGMEPEIVEIYFDNKYLCDIKEDMHPDFALALIQSSLINKLSA